MYFAVVKKSKAIKIIAIVLTLVLAVALSINYGTNLVFASAKKLPVYRVRTQQKKIAISFDCAWGVDYTDRLLEIMEKEQVKCTFFMVEFWTKKHPDYVKKIFEKGHEIGTHSATHPYMSKLDKSTIEKELISSSKAIEDITGKKVVTFRPPYGDYDDLLIDTANELGLLPIQWDVDSLDWKNLSASQIQQRVLTRVKSGSIVLFHNQGLHTADALEGIISTLKGQGYQFVSVSDLTYRDGYKIAPDGEQYLSS